MPYLYVFRFDNEDLINYGFTVIYDKLGGISSDNIIWIYEQEVICLTSIPYETQHLKELLSALQGVHCGGSDGRPIRVEADLSLKYKQAKRCLELTDQWNSNLILFQNIGVERFLFLIKEESSMQEAARGLLKPLLEFDECNHAELTKTLDVYLKNFFSLKKVQRNYLSTVIL